MNGNEITCLGIALNLLGRVFLAANGQFMSPRVVQASVLIATGNVGLSFQLAQTVRK